MENFNINDNPTLDDGSGNFVKDVYVVIKRLLISKVVLPLYLRMFLVLVRLEKKVWVLNGIRVQ